MRKRPRMRSEDDRRDGAPLGGRVLVGEGMGTVLAILLAACSAFAVDLPSLIRNESEAIRTLRLLAAEQERFAKAGVVDQDRNGRGEYGLICELTGEVPYRGGGGKRWRPMFARSALPTGGAEGKGFASRSGYRFRMFLGAPESAQGDDRTIAGRTIGDRLSVHAQEMEFNLYAWPEVAGETGRSAFHADSLTSTGMLFYTDMSGRRYSGDEGPGAFAILRPPGSPPHVLRTLNRDEASSDGNVWYPALERVASLRSLLDAQRDAAEPAAPLAIDFASTSDGPWTLYRIDDVRLSGKVTAVHASGSRIWIGIPGGVSVLDGGSWRSFAVERGDGDTIIRRIVPGRKPWLWFVGRWTAVKTDGKAWQDVRGDFPASPILAVTSLRDRVCLGFAKHLFLLGGQAPLTVDLRRTYFDRNVESLCASRPNDIYVGTYQRVDHFAGAVLRRAYTPADGLPSGSYVYWLAFDRSGTLWAATHAGLFKRAGASWERVRETGADRPKKVQRILCDRAGGLWIAADGGLSRLAGGVWRHVDPPLLEDLGEITGMAEGEDGAVYVSGDGGLLRCAREAAH